MHGTTNQVLFVCCNMVDNEENGPSFLLADELHMLQIVTACCSQQANSVLISHNLRLTSVPAASLTWLYRIWAEGNEAWGMLPAQSQLQRQRRPAAGGQWSGDAGRLAQTGTPQLRGTECPSRRSLSQPAVKQGMVSVCL